MPAVYRPWKRLLVAGCWLLAAEAEAEAARATDPAPDLAANNQQPTTNNQQPTTNNQLHLPPTTSN
jgi:hypothetical protein